MADPLTPATVRALLTAAAPHLLVLNSAVLAHTLLEAWEQNTALEAERDESDRALEAIAVILAMTINERDEARAEVARLREALAAPTVPADLVVCYAPAAVKPAPTPHNCSNPNSKEK